MTTETLEKVVAGGALDLEALLALRTVLAGTTAGPWYPGHLCDEDSTCNCASILSDTGIMGAVATVHYDNGLPVGEGGNDAPPISEAKANQRFIATFNPELVLRLLDEIDALRDKASTADAVTRGV